MSTGEASGRALEASGRTTEEAIERALDELGTVREDVEIEVLQDPKPALLGFGGREARVRLTRRPPAGEVLGSLTSQIVALMGYPAQVEAKESEEGLVATLRGRELGGLIGRSGRVLDALQLLAGLHLQRRLGRRIPVVVDATGYRAKRERAVQEAALKAADRASTEGVPVALEPMAPRERRIAHLALKDDPRVTTLSRGEDDARQVVVLPAPGTAPTAPSPTAPSRGAAEEEDGLTDGE